MMKKILLKYIRYLWLVTFLVTGVGFMFPNTTFALEEEDLSAAGAILVEVDMADGTYEILWGKNENTALKMASLTKLTTALLFLEYAGDNPGYESEVFSRDKVSGTSADLVVGAKFRLDELLYGLMLPSGNDAAMVIADNIGRDYLNGDDSEGPNDAINLFVNKMNERAVELGMTETTFKNPHGLDEVGHEMSAEDLVKVTMELMKYPFAMEVMGSDFHNGVTIANPNPASPFYKWVNTNQAICEYPGTIGGKTGTTHGAKQNLVLITERGGKRLIAVITNAAPVLIKSKYSSH